MDMRGVTIELSEMDSIDIDDDLLALNKRINYKNMMRESLGDDVYISALVMLSKYFRAENKYRKNQRQQPVLKKDIVLIVLLLIFTLGV